MSNISEMLEDVSMQAESVIRIALMEVFDMLFFKNYYERHITLDERQKLIDAVMSYAPSDEYGWTHDEKEDLNELIATIREKIGLK